MVILNNVLSWQMVSTDIFDNTDKQPFFTLQIKPGNIIKAYVIVINKIILTRIIFKH